jgi:8-oxo-dGTP diphosphatase
MPIYAMPYCRVEIALQSVVDGRLMTLFARREDAPFKGAWGLPGGALRIDLDSDLDAAARRIAQERLQCTLPNLQQLGTVGAKGRDPRGEHSWGLSVVYRSLVSQEALNPKPGKRVAGFKWIPTDDLSEDAKFAFDHLFLANQAMQATRTEFAGLRLPTGYIPEKFTLPLLQELCEQVLGTQLDKSSFRRKLGERHLVELMEGEFTTGVKNRPAAIYRLRQTGPREHIE